MERSCVKLRHNSDRLLATEITTSVQGSGTKPWGKNTGPLVETSFSRF